MHVTIGDISKGVGASYSWTSEGQGNGKIKYREVVANQLIESELYFGAPEDEPAQGLMIFAPVGDGIKVTWEVHMDMGNNPMMRIMGRFMDDMVGSTFEMGLKSVKTICEENLANNIQEIMENYGDVQISVIQVASKPYIGILDSCSIPEMGAKIGADYGALGAYLGANQLQPDGFVRIIYHVYEPPTKIVFEPLFVLANEVNVTDDRIHGGNTYEGKVITATHLGSYEKSYHVWEALDQYMKDNNLEMNGMPWEQYENTPRDEPNPDKLITHIFMPVK
jgi:effector-binding domain-containing protein